MQNNVTFVQVRSAANRGAARLSQVTSLPQNPDILSVWLELPNSDRFSPKLVTYFQPKIVYETVSLIPLQRCNCLWLLRGPTPVQPRHQDRETPTRVSQIVRQDRPRRDKQTSENIKQNQDGETSTRVSQIVRQDRTRQDKQTSKNIKQNQDGGTTTRVSPLVRQDKTRQTKKSNKVKIEKPNTGEVKLSVWTWNYINVGAKRITPDLSIYKDSTTCLTPCVVNTASPRLRF